MQGSRSTMSWGDANAAAACRRLPSPMCGSAIRKVERFSATAETITADGYVRTGDLAELDGEGGFTFLSRMGDVLRLSGFLVNPLEIETHLQKLPGIAGCQA